MKGVKEGLQRSMNNYLGVLDVLIILTVIVTSWVFANIKTH